MQDGTLIRVTKMDDILKEDTEMRLLSKFFSDFTDFIETIKDFCDRKDLDYEADVTKMRDMTKITFYSFDENVTNIYGEMTVQVCVDSYICVKEFNRRK